ncbi:DUF1304 domain-containing protein [Clavibacter michiganensis]|uniref:DUF1304 domain-containing protein n=1 Tax=Clavibacter michiganensis TaxID=28447 RepID=UPI003DA0F12C
MTAVAATGTIFVGLAALLHVFFFLLESVWFEKPFAWKRFGVADQKKALIIKPWAYNQGFYNLFLALGAGLGLILYFVGNAPAGLTLVLFTTACMVLASIIIASTGKKYLVPALIQGVPPLLGLVFFAAAS